MKRRKIYVLVQNFQGMNHDVEIYKSFKDARRGFREYTGFGFSKLYTDPCSKKYSEKFSETKIFELDLPDFLELRKGGVRYEKRRQG